MKNFNGVAKGINADIVGKLTRIRKPIFRRKNYILVSDDHKKFDIGYAGYVCHSTNPDKEDRYKKTVLVQDLANFIYNENDIVTLSNNGVISFVWEYNLKSNGIFVTSACNCNCIMCPQPPEPHDKELTRQNFMILDLIDQKYDGEIFFTGGEPTLLGDGFLDLMQYCARHVPNASISVLTNAKAFSDIELVRKLALLGIQRLLICVSLHGDVDTLHDLIVGSKGSFRKTQLGLYNLARFGIPTEIRVVVNKKNYRRLPQISEYFYRNFSFVCHVTFMALEICGFAREHFDEVWIDPYEYRVELDRAIHILHQRGMNVSAYNHQLCVMLDRTRKFAKKSISQWKNIYSDVCNECSCKMECCGFFSTSDGKYSNHIKPLSN